MSIQENNKKIKKALPHWHGRSKMVMLDLERTLINSYEGKHARKD